MAEAALFIAVFLIASFTGCLSPELPGLTATSEARGAGQAMSPVVYPQEVEVV